MRGGFSSAGGHTAINPPRWTVSHTYKALPDTDWLLFASIASIPIMANSTIRVCIPWTPTANRNPHSISVCIPMSMCNYERVVSFFPFLFNDSILIFCP